MSSCDQDQCIEIKEHEAGQVSVLSASTMASTQPGLGVSLLTGGSDRPYVFGLTTSLMSRGVCIDLIGSDELDFPAFRNRCGLKFLNLRGSLQVDVGALGKVVRVLKYYARLSRYALTAEPTIFHILWNNKFEHFDRTLLMLYYRMLGKKIVLTVHNVNAERRDARDTHINRTTLRIQYHLAHHIFVHTERMKEELVQEFGVWRNKVTRIPFGINNAVPITSLTASEAKTRLGLSRNEKAILFFGRITPYKGLEYLIAAYRRLLARHSDYRLIIAGRPDRCEEYWKNIRDGIREDVQRGHILLKAEFIPDEETEVYFKAADAVVLPYKDIYQSGVLFLGQSFGLPVVAADVGSLKDDVLEGKTGFTFHPEDPVDLAETIERYFASDLYTDLTWRRREIRDYAVKRHSWEVVAHETMNVYANLLELPFPEKSLACEMPPSSVEVELPS